MSEKLKAYKAECQAEKEHGHEENYLTFVHQSDGTCYYRCETCGWIKYDVNTLRALLFGELPNSSSYAGKEDV